MDWNLIVETGVNDLSGHLDRTDQYDFPQMLERRFSNPFTSGSLDEDAPVGLIEISPNGIDIQDGVIGIPRQNAAGIGFFPLDDLFFFGQTQRVE